MRNSPYGSVQCAVAAAYKAAGGLEKVSEALGLGTSTLSEAAGDSEKRPHGLGINYLHILGQIKPGAAEPIARHFAALAGGVYQPVTAESLCLQSAIARAAKEGGESVGYSIGLGPDASRDQLAQAEKEAIEACEAWNEHLAAIRERIKATAPGATPIQRAG